MIYLSGPISNSDPKIQQENLDRMNEKASQMSEPCFNPATLETKGWTWEKYLVRDLMWIATNRPKLYMMKGWETSKGCRLEHELAIFLDLPIEYEEN
jgi:hypothetical protein